MTLAIICTDYPGIKYAFIGTNNENWLQYYDDCYYSSSSISSTYYQVARLVVDPQRYLARVSTRRSPLRKVVVYSSNFLLVSLATVATVVP